jgi:hypothetical protein
MYVKHVMRGKAHTLFKRVAIFKGYLVRLVAHVRAKIMNRNCTKVQKSIKKYLLDKRLQKIK